MELASLEARLREMEERLKKSTRGDRPDLSLQAPTHPPPPPPPAKDDKGRSRPGTARAPQQAPSAGNMPPTPGGSEGEHHRCRWPQEAANRSLQLDGDRE